MSKIDVMPIKRYLDNETEDFYEVIELCLGKKDYMLDYLNRAKKTLLGYEKQIEEVINNIEYHCTRKITNENFKKLLHDLDCCELARSNYMEFMRAIILPSEEEAIEYIRKSGLTKKQINKYTTNFLKKFPNQTAQVTYINNIYDKYYEKYKKYSFTNNEKTSKVGLKDEKIVSLLLDVYNSGLCFEEYLSKVGNIRTATFVNELDSLIIPTKEKYYKIIKEVIKRDNQDFYKYLINSAYEINNKEDFDILDYHSYTNFPYEEYIKYIMSLLGDCEISRNVRRKIREKYKALPSEFNYSINSIMEGDIFIKDREITKDEKIKIISFIQENNLSLNLFRIILKKYLDNDLDLDQKVLIKR